MDLLWRGGALTEEPVCRLTKVTSKTLSVTATIDSYQHRTNRHHADNVGTLVYSVNKNLHFENVGNPNKFSSSV